MRILLTGGGTGGSVSPLLAVADAIKEIHPHTKFLFVGGFGVEKTMVEKYGVPFVGISSGKLRRYFSFQNLWAPFLSLKGFFEAKKIIKDFKPDAVFGTGSFVQVPVVWAAYFAKVPVVLHQQDVFPSLSNKLCQMAASKITVTFENSLTDFYNGSGLLYKKPTDKVVLTGNPFRKSFSEATKESGLKHFKLKEDLPVMLVLGGGTGAEGINKVVLQALPELTKLVQIIHVSGKGKSQNKPGENYHPFEFISEMGLAYAAADFVISRCGLSTLTELANLKKSSILVPMPQSHQEFNGWLLEKLGAAIVIRQKNFKSEFLPKIIRKFLFDLELRKTLSANISKIMPKNADEKIAKIIIKLAEKE